MGNFQYSFQFDEEKANNIKLLYVTSSKYEGDWPSFMHSHHFTELFYVKSGSGCFKIEDLSLPIKKDDLIIVNPNISHTEVSDKNNPLNYITLGVEGLSFSFEHEKNYTVINCHQQVNDLLFYFRSMLYELENKGDGYQSVCTSLLNILTIQLHRLTNCDFNIIVSSPSNKECAKIKRYIDANYQDPITLDFLAEMAHLNKYYFSHVFSETYGYSPINYLNERRISVSKELLKTTDYSIAEIARLSGFSSQSYFSQSFKKSCDMSAGSYRKFLKQKHASNSKKA